MELFYYKDIADNYDGLMSAAYEKANIWPMGTAKDGINIMDEEIGEAFAKFDALDTYWLAIIKGAQEAEPRIPTGLEMETVRAHALSAILELLQVVAVCNKYQSVFETVHRGRKGMECEENAD